MVRATAAGAGAAARAGAAAAAGGGGRRGGGAAGGGGRRGGAAATHVTVDLRGAKPAACIAWSDGTRSFTTAAACSSLTVY